MHDDDVSTQSRIRSPAPLRAAICSFTASADIRANAAVIAEAISQAHQAGVRLLLTPEAALTGYPGGGRDDIEGIDWASVASLEDALAEQALERGICLVLGTGTLTGSTVTNTALVCGSIDHEYRYHKRCLTPWDGEHYVPGVSPVVAEIDGWRLGLAICFDVRFASIWADLARAKADLFCCIAHMAGPDPDPGVKNRVIAAMLGTRAAEWATPLLFCNTAAPDRWLESGLWDARGIQTEAGGEGLLVTTVRPRQAHAPWYQQLRQMALQHQSGQPA